MTEPVGVLVMAYGTASGPDDVERYYTDIRGGRPPSPEHLVDLMERYAAIGNRFPLLEITIRQAEGLARALNQDEAGPRFRAYLGMKHSPPFIAEGVARMREDRIRRAVGIVMAPHWSGMSIETYVERVERAVAESGGPAFTFVRQWHDHPAFVDLLAARVQAALGRIEPGLRERAALVVSAHSLPQRAAEDGTRCLTCRLCPGGCRYVAQLHETAEALRSRTGVGTVRVGWQSAGRTADPWLGPSVDELIAGLAGSGCRAVVVCSAGFVADHLEVLHDLDIEARRTAERAGLEFARTEMPNDDPRFVATLADVVRTHVIEPAAGRG